VVKTLILAASTTPVKTSTALVVSKFGDYYTPFAVDSLWNSRPVEPVFGTFVIPKSSYYPAIQAGAYSTGVFLSSASDAPMTVYAITGKPGVINQDAEIFVPSITIPHWPAATLAATGSDGHADIVDPTTGIIHSFFGLKQDSGKWVAQLYAWMPIAGTGWADPAHYYQGARAVGIPASAGLIRRHEVDDGKATYMHALAMSLTYNAMAATPPYIYPATSADTSASQNTGAIPEGARMMLPASYDTSKIASPALRKVADTLKLYGAYVVDRNDGTPFNINVEIGSTFSMSKLSWDNAVAAELDRIRANLRQVVGAKSWVDGDGNAIAAPVTLMAKGTLAVASSTVAGLTPPANLNLLSMRGPWQLSAGAALGTFNSWTQAIEFPASSVRVSQSNSNGRGLSKLSWAKPVVGGKLRMTAIATGGASLRVVVYSGSVVSFDSGNLGNGGFCDFTWPANGWITLYAASAIYGKPTSGLPSSVRATLVPIQ